MQGNVGSTPDRGTKIPHALVQLKATGRNDGACTPQQKSPRAAIKTWGNQVNKYILKKEKDSNPRDLDAQQGLRMTVG